MIDVPDGVVADNRLREVDPAFVDAERMRGWIAFGVIVGGSLVSIAIGWVASLTTATALWLLSAWAAIAGFLAWFTMRYAEWAYARMRYRVSPEGIEIRYGILFRHVTAVARSRVQHIDVAEGPVLRRFGLAKLVLHTAGTSHATVELDGLPRDTAFALRDFLIDDDDTDTDTHTHTAPDGADA